jgi:threonine dehydrogenase-like Zn-dependent dehydrogenase
VTHRFSLDDAPRAVEVAAHPAPGVLKVMLQGNGTGVTAR